MSHWSSWLYPVIIFLTPLLTSASTRSEIYQLVDCCVSGTRTSRKRTPFAHLDIWPSILRAPPNAVLDQGLTEVSFASREEGEKEPGLCQYQHPSYPLPRNREINRTPLLHLRLHFSMLSCKTILQLIFGGRVTRRSVITRLRAYFGEKGR